MGGHPLPAAAQTAFFQTQHLGIIGYERYHCDLPGVPDFYLHSEDGRKIISPDVGVYYTFSTACNGHLLLLQTIHDDHDGSLNIASTL